MTLKNESAGPGRATGAEKKTTCSENTAGPGGCQALLSAALEYQQQGFSVVPVKPDKTPYIKWTAYQQQAADADQIRRWWKQWPQAWPGIVTGKVSGITVVDADSDQGADALGEFLPDGLAGIPIVKTPKGYHFYFKYVPGIKNAVRLLPDTDLRNDGGYVIAPPSKGGAYAWLQAAEAGPMPEGLADILKRPKEKPAERPKENQGNRQTTGESGGAYALAALDDESAKVRTAAKGSRNATLNRAAFAIGQLIAGGQIGRGIAENTLLDAAISAGLDRKEATATINSGFNAGYAEPRTAPDQDQQGQQSDQQTERKPPIQGISAADLLKLEFPEPRWAVDGILPEGLNILAGKPKHGKSLMALNLALSIAMGGRAFMQIPVEAGGVVGLFLEDPPRRLQRRIRQMMTGCTGTPNRLQLFTSWPRMGQGGIKQIDDLLSNMDDARLLIIDTLAKFRNPSRINGNAYEEDYAAVSRIKELADKHGVSILLIHHLRKMAAVDVFDNFSGTLGLTGAADGLLAMVKTPSGGTTLHVTGRDVEPAELAMELDAGLLSWRLIGNADEVRASEYQQAVYDFIKGAGGPVSPKDIESATGLKKHYLYDVLPKLTKGGGIIKKGYGQYIYKR